MGLTGMSDTGLSKVNPQGNQFRISMLMFLYQKILKMKISRMNLNGQLNCRVDGKPLQNLC